MSFETNSTALDGGLHEQLVATQYAVSRARRGWTLRVAIGFAVAALVAAVVIAPNAEEAVYQVALKLYGSGEEVTTASIKPAAKAASVAAPGAAAAKSGPRRYTIRRSIMQQPGEVCIVNGDGPDSCR